MRDADRRLEQQIAARGSRPATEHDLIGIEGVDRVGDPDPDHPRPLPQHRQRACIAALGRPHDVSPVGHPDPGGEAAERASGGEVLQ